MTYDGFIDSARDYGLRKLVKDSDFLLAIGVTVTAILIHKFTNLDIVKQSFIKNATPLAISLLAFIITGLAIVASFSDAEFIAFLKDTEAWTPIMFTFQFNIYLTTLVSLLGIVLQTYPISTFKCYSAGPITGEIGLFSIFSFLFLYMVFSIANYTAAIIMYGDRQAEYWKSNQ